MTKAGYSEINFTQGQQLEVADLLEDTLDFVIYLGCLKQGFLYFCVSLGFRIVIFSRVRRVYPCSCPRKGGDAT